MGQSLFEQGQSLESIAQRGLERIGRRSRSHSGEYIPRTGQLACIIDGKLFFWSLLASGSVPLARKLAIATEAIMNDGV